MKKLYDYPQYYEIAFSFREIKNEVDLMEELFRRYGKGRLKSFLELSSGHSPHLTEIIKRGYEYTGIELNKKMIKYTKNRYSGHPDRFRIIRVNMNNFKIKQKTDFAFVMLDSFYALTDKEIKTHFKSVYDALKKGDLYLLDWVVKFNWDEWEDQVWQTKKDQVAIKVLYACKDINYQNQIYNEYIKLDVNDDSKTLVLEEKSKKRIFFPNEFKLLMEHLGFFSIVGMWNNFDLNQPITEKYNQKFSRPIILLKKK